MKKASASLITIVVLIVAIILIVKSPSFGTGAVFNPDVISVEKVGDIIQVNQLQKPQCGHPSNSQPSYQSLNSKAVFVDTTPYYCKGSYFATVNYHSDTRIDFCTRNSRVKSYRPPEDARFSSETPFPLELEGKHDVTVYAYLCCDGMVKTSQGIRPECEIHKITKKIDFGDSSPVLPPDDKVAESTPKEPKQLIPADPITTIKNIGFFQYLFEWFKSFFK